MNSTSEFEFDAFLSHSSKDAAAVLAIAHRLKKDGLRVWIDKWILKPGDSIPATIEAGLESSRVLVLCMSTNAFGADWPQLESYTFRFRDPLNRERRFIPLKLDGAAIKGSLAQFLYIDWQSGGDDNAYAQLFEACRPTTKPEGEYKKKTRPVASQIAVRLKMSTEIESCAFSRDGNRALTAGDDLRLWDIKSGSCSRILEGHTEGACSVAWSSDGKFALSGSDDNTARVWNLETGECLSVFEGHTDLISCVAWSPDGRFALTGSWDRTVRIWNVRTGESRILEGHSDEVESVAWSADQNAVLSGAGDNTVRLWDVNTGHCQRVLEGHTDVVSCVVWGPDKSWALSGSWDNTVCVWDPQSGRLLKVLDGHTDFVNAVAWTSDGRHALSGADDKTVRLWDVREGRCLRVLKGHASSIVGVAWSGDNRRAHCGDQAGRIRVWDLSQFLTETSTPDTVIATVEAPPEQIQYTNAKVLLVGESGAGKTGLSKVLANEKWEASDSTVGAWATQWKLDVASDDGVEREIWLWDFGGQADQRLIHQLYMDETALAALIFDGQKEDLFDKLCQWDRDLDRAPNKAFAKLLVAGRTDAGGLRVSRSEIEEFVKERGYLSFIETSAKVGTGCKRLKEAILNGIKWKDIPWRSSPLLFKRLKEEIIRLKDQDLVLMRFKELRDTLQLRLAGVPSFDDNALKGVLNLLAGPGVVWELNFGSWVLLQPERINAYGQAVIQTMTADEHERGCLPEEQVLNGDLKYSSSMPRLETDEERIVLLAMHQIFVGRGICLREHTENGTLLVFPSYYRRERPELLGHPAVVVSYRFRGFLDDIYATLVVRLHHTRPFQQDKLWRYAADFKTLTNKKLGVKLSRRAEGAGELEVYFDPSIPMEERIIFSKYIHEHLLKNATEVVRLRHYTCPHCGTPVGNREIARKKLEEGKKDIPCMNCDDPAKRIPLWDELEELFASPTMKQQVRVLEGQSATVLDSESKERELVGEVISTASLAGQICRELTVSDHGIDMEIEFKSDAGNATGRKLYLQLKSGHSFLKKRKSDGAEIFRIEEARHADYWLEQQFPVLLVIRNSEGETRWMEIRDYLKRESGDGKKPVKQLIFKGERLDVMSVRRWREKLLAANAAP